MNKRERLTAATGFRPVDRMPVGAWGHFLHDEMDPAALTEAQAGWVEQYDFDLLKIQPRASYQVEGWGYEFTPSPSNGTPHVFVRHPISSAADWKALEPLPLTAPPLAQQLDLVRRMRARVGPGMPLLMTVFAPMDMAEKLVNRDPAALRHYLAEAPDAIKYALEVFAVTFAAFVRELVAIGVDGIFMSSRWTNPDRMAHADYVRMARQRDLDVLAPAAHLPFNFMHLCGGNIGIAMVRDYPVSVLHWDQAVVGNPTMAEGQRIGGKAVCGGVPPKRLPALTPEEICQDVRTAIRETGGIGYIAAPGCTTPIHGTNEANFRALRAVSEEAALPWQ